MFTENPQSEFVNIAEFIQDNRELIEPIMYFYDKLLRSKSPDEIEDIIIEQICVMTAIHVLCNSCEPQDYIDGLISMSEEGIDARFIEWINTLLVHHSIWKLERLDLIEPSNDANGYKLTKKANFL